MKRDGEFINGEFHQRTVPHRPKAKRAEVTDAQIMDWVSRHGLDGLSLTDARCAFEDARTLRAARR